MRLMTTVQWEILHGGQISSLGGQTPYGKHNMDTLGSPSGSVFFHRQQRLHHGFWSKAVSWVCVNGHSRKNQTPRCDDTPRSMDEPRMNIHHSVTNGDRLVEWLGKSGFERLDAEKLGLWMDSRIKNNDAYGSVVVLGRGFALPTYWNPPTNLYGSAISAREDAWSTSEAIFLSGT